MIPSLSKFIMAGQCSHPEVVASHTSWRAFISIAIRSLSAVLWASFLAMSLAQATFYHHLLNAESRCRQDHNIVVSVAA